jgi:hypothetical protein
MSPQGLKPELFSITYVRAEARTLQKNEFFRSLPDGGLAGIEFSLHTRCTDLDWAGRRP